MKYLNNLLLCGIILLLITNLNAQDKTDPTRWTPEDIINTENMSEVSIAPDNSMVVGAPGKIIRTLNEQQVQMLKMNADVYVHNAARFAKGLKVIS